MPSSHQCEPLCELQVQTVYRGVSGVLPSEFWTPDEHNIRGGVEPAFMSTSLDQAVATQYASGSGKPGAVLCIGMGMIERGADLSWLSQYPHERECVWRPSARTRAVVCLATK